MEFFMVCRFGPQEEPPGSLDDFFGTWLPRILPPVVLLAKKYTMGMSGGSIRNLPGSTHQPTGVDAAGRTNTGRGYRRIIDTPLQGSGGAVLPNDNYRD